MLTDDLKTLLASSFSFYLKTANYHWNIEGPSFIEYHPWLGELYSGVSDSVDQIAEYIRATQAYAPASLARFQELTQITDQIDIVQPSRMFQQLLVDNQRMLDLFNQAFASATAANQQGIANFLAERIDFHQKYAWQIRSTLKTLEA